MIKRILLAWFVANFLIAGVYALIAGDWYIRLPVFQSMAAELGLIMLPNLIFPILLLRYAWVTPVGSLSEALGWKWNGWRAIGIGVAAIGIYLILSSLRDRLLGPSIPYNMPGETRGVSGLAGLLLLLVYILFVVITVTGEETMFRGLIQTQVSQRYGLWIGFILTVLLFGLRHLPADIFYGGVWQVTPHMWLSRQVDLYLGSILLALARYFGKSTYASATMHLLIFVAGIVSGFF